MSAPAKPKPKRIRYRRVGQRSTDPMDMRRAVEVLARDDAERMSGPRAEPCSCSKPWIVEERRCVWCGHEVRPA